MVYRQCIQDVYGRLCSNDNRSRRPKEPENKAVIVDFYDNCEYLRKQTSRRLETYEDYYGKYYKPKHIDL